MSAVLKEAGVEVAPSQLSRMEDGTRPGDPKVWGLMWEALHLPLAELYEGLGLPVPSELPTGLVAEIMQLVEGMPTEAQRLTLSFARTAPAMLDNALRHSPLVAARAGDNNSTTGEPTEGELAASEKLPWRRAAEEQGRYEPKGSGR